MGYVRHTIRAAGLVTCAVAAASAGAQALSVQPVTIQLLAGQRAAAMTVVNQGLVETSFQVRAFAWGQAADGSEVLTNSDAIVASPPLGTIPPGGRQVVRLILREAPQDRESSYRLLLDQIPPPAAPGTVQVALRLSLPIFALPTAKVAPTVRFSIEQAAGAAYLVASNDGKRHEKIQDIELRNGTSTVLRVEAGSSPYVLPGAVRRWRIVAPDGLQPGGGSLSLSARAEVIKVASLPVAITSLP
jgi:fimbrial chaperone protein